MNMENHKKYIGDFKSTFIAQSRDKSVRERGSSGGVVTSLLRFVLEKKIADSVICVGYNEEKPYKYEIVKVNTAEDLLKTIGSKYVKIPLAGVLRLLDENEKTVLVGLPCVIEPLSRLHKKGRYKNVILKIGLFCGWGMDYDATEYLIGKTGIKKTEIKRIDYRGGDYPGGFLVEDRRGIAKGFKKHHYDIVNLMFIPESCMSCNFYTSESSDISVGDAWIKGKRNWSTVIIRSAAGERMYEKSIKNGYINSEKIDYDKIIKYHWHNIKYKKFGPSAATKVFIKLLNNGVSRRLAPLGLLGFLAKMRRRVKGKSYG